jgi:hypothetical protein
MMSNRSSSAADSVVYNNITTVMLSKTESLINGNDNHLDIFSLVWLNTDGIIKDNRDTEQKLRTIINHLKKFDDAKECQQYIEQRSKQDRLVVVISGQLGQEIVPSIHKLRQVLSIYIYCNDKKSNEQWTNKFRKVTLK